MKPIHFEMRTPPPSGHPPRESEPIEYIVIPLPGGDVVCRAATDADREAHPDVYAAFKAPPAPVVTPAPTAPTEEPKRSFFGKGKTK